MPPAKTSSKPPAQPKRGRQKDIVYNILLECAVLVKDEFWTQFYEDLSAGKSTKGIYISNGVIQTSNKRNGFTYSITDKAPEVIVAELHHLLTTHTSICSRKDLTKKRLLVKEIEDELNSYDQAKWTSIKRKNIRNMLIVDWAIHLQKTHQLSWPATITAYQVIIGAFESKTHTSKDVNYEDGKILSIDDIELNEEETGIINLREDQILDTPTELPEEKAILLQNLFEPYILAWRKAIKN